MTKPHDYDPPAGRRTDWSVAPKSDPADQPAGAPPQAIANDLRRLADTPGHQLTDAYRDGLRTLAGEVSKLAEPVSGLHPIPIEPTPRQAGDQIRRLTREVREIHHKLTRRDAEPATAELDAAGFGLDLEQSSRAAAAQAIGWRSPGDTDLPEYHDWWWTELDRLAAYISTGGRP